MTFLDNGATIQAAPPASRCGQRHIVPGFQLEQWTACVRREIQRTADQYVEYCELHGRGRHLKVVSITPNGRDQTTLSACRIRVVSVVAVFDQAVQLTQAPSRFFLLSNVSFNGIAQPAGIAADSSRFHPSTDENVDDHLLRQHRRRHDGLKSLRDASTTSISMGPRSILERARRQYDGNSTTTVYRLLAISTLPPRPARRVGVNFQAAVNTGDNGSRALTTRRLQSRRLQRRRPVNTGDNLQFGVQQVTDVAV